MFAVVKKLNAITACLRKAYLEDGVTAAEEERVVRYASFRLVIFH